MLYYRQGSIFDAQTQVIVNTVNCRGAMGKGLALAFKQRYPAMFEIYRQDCFSGHLRIGHPTLYRGTTPWVLNFPTKDDWRNPSSLAIIEASLKYFCTNYERAGIVSIAFPRLGCQNGGLSWQQVEPLMLRHLQPLPIEVHLYAPVSSVHAP